MKGECRCMRKVVVSWHTPDNEGTAQVIQHDVQVRLLIALTLPCLTALATTTRDSRYEKKHSPIHTYCGHQSSLICFIHLLRSMASSMFNPRA